MKEYTLKLSPANLDSHSEQAEVHSILALDLGIGSYGIALQKRSGKGETRQFTFPLVRSCTLPGDWAALDEVRTARRMWRTRIAHKRREKWLREVFTRSGLGDAVLHGRQISAVKAKQMDGTMRYVLDKPGDYRLEREFPPQAGEPVRDGAPNDEAGARTVYNGAALRCLLLLGPEAQKAVQGSELSAWQVFKALHSAIQQRGYDPRVPWARVAAVAIGDPDGKSPTKAKKGKKEDAATLTEDAGGAAMKSETELAEEKENQASEARALTMKAIVEGLHGDSRYHHPCFWEAAQMGLWSPDQPEGVALRQDHHARSCKWADREDPAQALKPIGERDKYAKLPAIFPRQMVEAELYALCEAAGQLLPELQGQAWNIIYGPVGMAYPTIPRRDPELQAIETQRREALAALPDDLRAKFVRGKEAEWQGALAQKAPTFDNRGPSPCVLFPLRFNVAKCDLRQTKDGSIEPDSLLASEVSFLLQLKNFRFTPEVKDDSAPGGIRDAFTPAELRQIFEDTFTSIVVPRIQKSMSGALTKRCSATGWARTSAPRPRPNPDSMARVRRSSTPRKRVAARASHVPAFASSRHYCLLVNHPLNSRQHCLI
jgi:CRISPR-associated endonuclease Csn1